MGEKIPVFSSKEIPSGTILFKFGEHFAPLGYRVNESGVDKRIHYSQRWKKITYTPCIVSGVERKNGSTRIKIKFMTSSGEIREIPVLASYAFSSKIAKLLREEGANCTSEDGKKLSKYLLDSYMTLQNEARKV